MEFVTGAPIRRESSRLASPGCHGHDDPVHIADRLDDLPWAPYLEPPVGSEVTLLREGRFESLQVADAELAGVDASGALLFESVLSRVTVDGGNFRRTRFRDMWFEGTRWIGSDLVGSEWRDVHVVNSVFAGTQAFDTKLERVVLRECKLDSVNLRDAKLTDVHFVDCHLKDVDFGSAQLAQVTFAGTRIQAALFEHARLREVDFTGATELQFASGFESLRGAVISGAQLIELAPAFARALGVVVRD